MAKLKIGLAGCGTIAFSGAGYLVGIDSICDKVDLVAVCDSIFERARKVVDEYGAREQYRDIDEMLDRADIDAVVNLTPIPLHGEINLKVLRAGKHLITEKPIATTMEDAYAILDEAQAKNLKIVAAPPDMLYPHIQEVRKLIATGVIGQVCFARVHSSHGGPASFPFWPTDPTWFYQKGSGPLLDMGVYGITQITGILGPARRVVAFSGITEPEREVAGGPARGKKIKVTEDDNTLLMLDFGQSAYAVVDGTFNLIAAKGPWLEVYGRRGTVNINNRWWSPDAPMYEVFSLVNQSEPPMWESSNLDAVLAAESKIQKLQRTALIEHLADCVAGDSPPIVSGEHATHVLEIMLKAIQSAREGRVLDLETAFEMP